MGTGKERKKDCGTRLEGTRLPAKPIMKQCVAESSFLWEREWNWQNEKELNTENVAKWCGQSSCCFTADKKSLCAIILLLRHGFLQPCGLPVLPREKFWQKPRACAFFLHSSINY